MKPETIQKDQTGFTIVELLITLIVGAIVVTGLNSIVTTQSYISQRGRDMILANSFAETKVEALRSQGFLSTPLGSTDITNELPAELNTPRSATMEISPHTTASKKITITMSYNEQGRQRTYSYSTLIGELGVGQY